MATYNSTTYAAQAAAADNSGSMLDTGELISGKVQFLQCEVLIPAGTLINDIINIGFLPSGVTVIPGLITITTEITAGSNAFSIAASVDGLICSSATATGTGTALLSTASVGNLKITERQDLCLTLLTAGLTSGGKFFVNIPLVNSN